ncbi:MAG TPA: hypothetical protein DD435_02800 [Cyanobacteria bacterium UBA8530]|nr:hypothetical protein [Cyanobacteria bacterium UBA8530]
MSYDIRYSLINTFKAVDQWRANVLLNMGSAATPGFKMVKTDFGHNVSVQTSSQGIGPGSGAGSRPSVQTAVGHLYVSRTEVQLDDTITGRVRQGKADGSAGDLAIAGSPNSFFAVAESTNPGSRVFLTRGGDFEFKLEKGADGKDRFRLKTKSGLYVLRNVDFDPTAMTVTDNNKIKNGSATYPQLLDFYNKLGWPRNTQKNYLADFDKTPTDTPAFRDFMKNFADAGIITANARRDDNPADPDHPIIHNEDFTNPAVMRDAVMERSDHTVDDKAADPYDIRGLVLAGVGNENQYTGKGPSHVAVVRVADASFLQMSSWGSSVFEIPKVYRNGISVSNNQKLLNETSTSSPVNVTERGIRIIGHMLDAPDSAEIISKMNQESEVTNFIYKNLSQLLTDYNKNIDDLLGLIR